MRWRGKKCRFLLILAESSNIENLKKLFMVWFKRPDFLSAIIAKVS